ncbi:kinase-like domain-containing protein [Desarmillaria tabescens]|uniref:Kinase-like domain-containing protein n=1 Tax=Armillaria tabescens TaxID=1929756 RepID=A0AA39MRS9_ARMTA|nr:kinase-like domain-containing protein [Desarmillaria tabescens]KAK0444257.1 kinase-like domain-containing protein [Desarmillaria tabescens]
MVSPSTSVSSAFSCCDHMRRLEEKISIEALKKLACKHAQSPSAHVQTPALQGSYNLVYIITFPDGRKWVARIPEPSFTDSQKIESMIGTMRLISDKTSLPLPIVHAYDSFPNNSLGYAYMFTSFIEGIRLSDIWTKPGALTDANRRHIFQQIANSMAQLCVLEFDSIGTLEFPGSDLSYTIGPLRKIEEGKVVHEIGPFPTALSYINELASSLADKNNERPSEYAHYSVLCLLSLFLPNPQFDGPPFVLSPPDFDSQNVMVDPQTFTVTGFLDWDNVFVGPREGGYARYPSWITRGWGPIMYDWPPRSHTHKEDSNRDQSVTGNAMPKDDEPVHNCSSREEPPEVLQAHRDLYYAIYSDIDPTGGEVTRRSHIFEAIVIALTDPALSAEIMSKLINHVFGDQWLGMGELLLGIEAGDWLANTRRGRGAHASSSES